MFASFVLSLSLSLSQRLVYAPDSPDNRQRCVCEGVCKFVCGCVLGWSVSCFCVNCRNSILERAPVWTDRSTVDSLAIFAAVVWLAACMAGAAMGTEMAVRWTGSDLKRCHRVSCQVARARG